MATTVLEELATAELFTVALDVTVDSSREAGAVATTESRLEGEDVRRQLLLLLDTLLQRTPTVPLSTRPAELTTAMALPPLTTTITRPVELMTATELLLQLLSTSLLQLLLLQPTELLQWRSTELPLTTATPVPPTMTTPSPGPALETTTTTRPAVLMIPTLPLLMSLTVLQLRSPTALHPHTRRTPLSRPDADVEGSGRLGLPPGDPPTGTGLLPGDPPPPGGQLPTGGPRLRGLADSSDRRLEPRDRAEGTRLPGVRTSSRDVDVV